MQHSQHSSGQLEHGRAVSLKPHFRKVWMQMALRGCAVALLGAALAAAAGRGQQGSGAAAPQAQIQLGPDANSPSDIREQQMKERMLKDQNELRSKQISEDSAKLLKLATELKAEVDKTSKDEMSLSVIKKADEIEKLARSVREKMKLEFVN